MQPIDTFYAFVAFTTVITIIVCVIGIALILSAIFDSLRGRK